MKRVRKINKPIEKNLDNYVNIETGETLQSELISNKEKIKVTKESDLITITSDDFVVIDSEIMLYIKSKLSSTDFSRLIVMSNMLKTEFNIVFNYTIPHTPTTLSKELELSIDDLGRMVKRLVDIGVLAYIVSKKSGIKRKIYMINPTFARKRKTFNEELMHIFEDFRKIETSKTK